MSEESLGRGSRSREATASDRLGSTPAYNEAARLRVHENTPAEDTLFLVGPNPWLIQNVGDFWYKPDALASDFIR